MHATAICLTVAGLLGGIIVFEILYKKEAARGNGTSSGAVLPFPPSAMIGTLIFVVMFFSAMTIDKIAASRDVAEQHIGARK